MWLGFVIFGLVVFLVIALINKKGETLDRLNKKNIDAHISAHHKETHNRRRD